MLEIEGVLDVVVREFHEYPDGTKVFRPDTNPWYVDGKVDRTWLWTQWGRGVMNCGEVHG
jgi:hypothetical protein